MDPEKARQIGRVEGMVEGLRTTVDSIERRVTRLENKQYGEGVEESSEDVAALRQDLEEVRAQMNGAAPSSLKDLAFMIYENATGTLQGLIATVVLLIVLTVLYIALEASGIDMPLLYVNSAPLRWIGW